MFGNGSGGESIFNGKKFKDERPGLLRKHHKRGILSMGSSGKNSNSSQWFFTFDAAPQCDGKYMVLGELVSGWEVLRAAEQLGSASGEPMAPVTVTDCGLWDPLQQSGAGYWYDQPDPDTYTGISPVFVVRPRVAVVAPTQAVLDKFAKALQAHHSAYHQFVCVEGEEATVAKLLNPLLESYAVDVVLVAPAYRNQTVEGSPTRASRTHCQTDRSGESDSNEVVAGRTIAMAAGRATLTWKNATRVVHGRSVC